MKTTLTYSFLTGIMLLISCLALTQENWELTKENDNIKVYFKKITDQKFDVRIEANFASPKEKILNIIDDHRSYPNWVYRCTLAEEKEIEGKTYLRTITDTPWPFKDRDAISYTSINKEINKNTTLIHSISKPDVIPPYEDYVRVKYSEVNWIITSIEKNTTHIQYTLSLEIQQEAPDFIIKLISTNAPFESFKNLEAILKSKN